MSGESEICITEANAITFAIIAKHLLPKDQVESISSILSSLLTEKITPQEMLQSVSAILENNQEVDMIWKTLIDRKGIRTSPLYNEISQIVQKFLDANVQKSHIISFVCTVMDSVKHGKKNVDLISIVLNFHFLTKYKGITIPNLLLHALQIASRIKPENYAKEPPKFENIHDLVVPEKPDLPPLLPSIRIKQDASKKEHSDGENKAPPVEEKRKNLGFSYQESKLFVSPAPYTFFCNTYAKSTMNGSEGAQDEKVSQFEKFLSYIKFYALSSFEKFVIADISYYAISRFGGDGSVILQKNAVQDLYDSEAATVLKYLEHTKDIDMLRKSCGEMLFKYAEYRYRVSERTSFFSDIMPIFDAQTSMKFSEESEKTVFMFDPSKSKGSFMIGEIAKFHLPRLLTFMKEVVTLFTCDKEECTLVLCNDAFASALFFFSRTCEGIESVFSPSPKGEMSIDAILESAACEVETKYENVVHSEMGQLTLNFMKEFLKGSEEFSHFDVMISKLGGKATLFFRMLANFIKLITIVERVLVDRNYARFMRIARFFGQEKGPHAEEKLRSRIPLMEAKIAPHFLGKLIMIEMNGTTKQMTITPSL